MKTAAGLVILAAATLSCASDRAVLPPRGTAGPPETQAPVIQRHAEQFEKEIGKRPAGSQEELVAASYILAHLQKAGYVVRLDFVPVENLVRSSNVVALPPGNKKPTAVVTVGYDGVGRGDHLGLFLELARALRVRAPEHSVEFVAVGAEHTRVRGGRLGSRRLVRVLLEQPSTPFVVVITDITSEGRAQARGDLDALRGGSGARPASGMGASSQRGSRGDPLLDRAGIRNLVVSGGGEEVARLLLDVLSATAD